MAKINYKQGDIIRRKSEWMKWPFNVRNLKFAAKVITGNTVRVVKILEDGTKRDLGNWNADRFELVDKLTIDNYPIF